MDKINEERIGIEKFGKDHWSLFVYIETRTVDYKGMLNKDYLRIKEQVDRAGQRILAPDWNPEWGTRLKGYFKDKDKNLQLPNHDDLDCFDDLECAGLIENMGTGLNPAAKLTKKGIEVAGKLRKHKASGGYFANFEVAE